MPYNDAGYEGIIKRASRGFQIFRQVGVEVLIVSCGSFREQLAYSGRAAIQMTLV